MIGGLDKVGSALVKPLLYIRIVLFKYFGDSWLDKYTEITERKSMDTRIGMDGAINTSIDMGIKYAYHTLLKRSCEKGGVDKINGVSSFISDSAIVYYYWVIHSVSVY